MSLKTILPTSHGKFLKFSLGALIFTTLLFTGCDRYCGKFSNAQLQTICNNNKAYFDSCRKAYCDSSEKMMINNPIVLKDTAYIYFGKSTLYAEVTGQGTVKIPQHAFTYTVASTVPGGPATTFTAYIGIYKGDANTVVTQDNGTPAQPYFDIRAGVVLDAYVPGAPSIPGVPTTPATGYPNEQLPALLAPAPAQVPGPGPGGHD